MELCFFGVFHSDSLSSLSLLITGEHELSCVLDKRIEKMDVLL